MTQRDSMTQTWTGRSQPWLTPLVLAAGLGAMGVILWAAFWYLSPANFNPGRAETGIMVARVIAVLLCLGGLWLLARILVAYTPTTVVLSKDEVVVRHGNSEHSIKLADVDAVLYVATSVQSGAGLFIYPREEYLARSGQERRYGKPDPNLTISLQRFTNADERAVALALRDNVKAAGGRFGTSLGPAAEA